MGEDREEIEEKRQWQGQTSSARAGHQGELKVTEKERFGDWSSCLWRTGVRD